MQSLVLENDATYQEKLVHTLDTMHIGVQVADTSDAALDLLSARRFDLTVLDMEIPGPESGRELARKNRPRMGTILIGERNFDDEVAGSRCSAPVYYLRKPIDYRLFEACLRALSEQNRLRLQVARLQRELRRLKGEARDDGVHEVDDLWLGILNRLQRGPWA
jgi:DNA-binding response OmpR family regulator